MKQSIDTLFNISPAFNYASCIAFGVSLGATLGFIGIGGDAIAVSIGWIIAHLLNLYIRWAIGRVTTEDKE